MGETHSVDDILVKAMAEQANGVKPMPVEPAKEPVKEPEPAPEAAPEPEAEPLPEAAEVAPEPEPEAAKDSPIDEYGNPVAPERVYTESEVQRMMKDRLSRGRRDAPAPQPETPKAVDAAAEGGEEWEQQLEALIDKTIDKKQKTAAQRQWQEQEAARQADYEVKFSTGMSKYKDFDQAIGKVRQSLTPEIMLATRGLENPAAFVYGAAKLHPQELDRIARIPDPYMQAAEVGRLHEKMVKQSKMISQADKPLSAPKSDVPAKTSNQPSIDSRIIAYGQQKAGKR